MREEKPTAEQIAQARKYQLPDCFYLYESKPPCPGCIGCTDGEPPFRISTKSKTSDQKGKTLFETSVSYCVDLIDLMEPGLLLVLTRYMMVQCLDHITWCGVRTEKTYCHTRGTHLGSHFSK